MSNLYHLAKAEADCRYQLEQLEQRISKERERLGDDWSTRDQRRAAEQLRYARWDLEDAEDAYDRARR